MFEACATFKLQGGTARLLQAMLDDAGVDVRLESRVARVHHGAERCDVRLADGSELAAAAVIVTTPLNVLGTIEFDPPLSETKRSAAAEGQASCGVKAWARPTRRIRTVRRARPEYRAVDLGTGRPCR